MQLIRINFGGRENAKIAGYALRIEDHYSSLAGRPTPMMGIRP